MKKFNKIIICCENTCDMNDAFTLKEFLSSFKINIVVHKQFISLKTCIGDRLNKEHLLICMTNRYAILSGTGSTTYNFELKTKLKKIYFSKGLFKNFNQIKKHFCLGLYRKYKKGIAEIVVDMYLLKKLIDYCLKSNRVQPSILDVVMHEITHIKYPEHCKDKNCLLSTTLGDTFFCKSCRNKFKKVINEKFRKFNRR